ncbi:MAG: T9SS type A sorting domain-containing protein [Ferruginibacter sp.]
MNTAYFELQHSQNGSDWIKIGTVAATGNSQSVINYSFTDNFPAPSINYYRLKMVDKDGSFIYSTVRKVNMKSNGSGVVVAQNPVINGNLSMQYNNPQNVKTVQLFNAGGAQIYSSSKVSEINVSSIQSGMYILKVSSPDGTSTSQKIIISN